MDLFSFGNHGSFEVQTEVRELDVVRILTSLFPQTVRYESSRLYHACPTCDLVQ